ncbi:protein kinase domain-containing protein [Nocardia sp. SSK8]|uniref:protein kinase domain-containing protein n=1 Tax=Nocardia sp. SSK8 TaxID=3120154 RepID=UPI00300885D1
MTAVEDTFAGYRIEGTLGQGGMGTVYRARHPRLPRTVALKLLNRAVSDDPELRRRFEQEADIVAGLDHPGIVGVYDRGTHDGHLWISMRFVEGADATRLPRETPPEQLLRYVAETADALDYAHRHGVLHRDVKPANILISSPEGGESRALLTDFGIARLVEADTKLTATGTFTATLAYASPEQLSGEVVDARGDQYSLACTLYLLLAGQPPFPATNPAQVIAGHLSQPVPPLSGVRPGLPAALDAVLTRAMAKAREDRFASCREFVSAAQDALLHNTFPASPGPTPGSGQAGYPAAGHTPPGSSATPQGYVQYSGHTPAGHALSQSAPQSPGHTPGAGHALAPGYAQHPDTPDSGHASQARYAQNPGPGAAGGHAPGAGYAYHPGFAAGHGYAPVPKVPGGDAKTAAVLSLVIAVASGYVGLAMVAHLMTMQPTDTSYSGRDAMTYTEDLWFTIGAVILLVPPAILSFVGSIALFMRRAVGRIFALLGATLVLLFAFVMAGMSLVDGDTAWIIAGLCVAIVPAGTILAARSKGTKRWLDQPRY